MKKINKVIILVLILAVSFFVIIVIKESHKYEIYSIEDLDETNQEQVTLFYSLTPDTISYGELFDVRYTFYNEINPLRGSIEIVRKTKSPMQEVKIGISGDYENVEDKKYSGVFYTSFDDNEVYDIITSDILFQQGEAVNEGKKFKMIIEYPGGSEVHILEADETNQIAVNKSALDLIGGNFYISYYYMNYLYSLYIYQIDEWENEMETLFNYYVNNEIKIEELSRFFSIVSYDDLDYEKAEEIERLLLESYKLGLIPNNHSKLKEWVNYMSEINMVTDSVDRNLYDSLLKKETIDLSDIEELLTNY